MTRAPKASLRENRLVAVKYSGDTIIENTYDGLNRRIKKVDHDADVTYDYYYNTSWQVLEARRTPAGGNESVHKQFVWDLRYIDAPVLRDRDADGSAGTGDYGKTGSGLEERLYYTNDANMNVTAVVDTDGAVAERYKYDPYGRVTFRKPDFSKTDGPDGQSGNADDGTAGEFANAILYAGYLYDDETGLFHVRNRTYHPTLGRWLQRDPLGYVDGMSLYEYVISAPTLLTDPAGLAGLPPIEIEKWLEGGSIQATIWESDDGKHKVTLSGKATKVDKCGPELTVVKVTFSISYSRSLDKDEGLGAKEVSVAGGGLTLQGPPKPPAMITKTLSRFGLQTQVQIPNPQVGVWEGAQAAAKAALNRISDALQGVEAAKASIHEIIGESYEAVSAETNGVVWCCGEDGAIQSNFCEVGLNYTRGIGSTQKRIVGIGINFGAEASVGGTLDLCEGKLKLSTTGQVNISIQVSNNWQATKEIAKAWEETIAEIQSDRLKLLKKQDVPDCAK